MHRALFAAFFLAVPVLARAHDTWLLPTRWTLPAGQRVVVDLTSAMDFPAPETAPQADRLVEKRIRLSGLISPLEVLQAQSGAKALQLAATPAAGGLATLWITTRPRTLDLKPDLVEHYLQEVGAADTIGEKWRRSPDKAWRETYVKVAKTFVRVEGSPKDESWREAVGATLELVPAADPTTLAPGQDVGFQLLWGGKPIADVAVGAVTAAPAKAVLRKSDREGRVSFRLDRAGPWLFRATLIRPAPGRGAEWESVFTTITLAVRP
jgi:uncharacterized GH25 family protein